MYIKRFLLTKWALYAIFFILLGILFFSPMDPNARPVYAATTAFDCTTVSEIPQLECEALVSLYENIDGPNWYDNTGWLENNTPCSWHGIDCSLESVASIELTTRGTSPIFGLKGDLPSEIGDLVNLKRLVLMYNEVNSVPSTIGNLVNLTELDFSNNQLSNLPSTIGNLNNLTMLSLLGNELASLPAEIGNLTNLRGLYLSDNALAILPSTIGNLNNLTTLSLWGNELSSLPDEIWTLTSLESLSLSSNPLGILPSTVGNLNNLRELSIGNNQLSSLPAELWTLTSLGSLSLMGNLLTSLPTEIGNLTGLEVLWLRSNQLSSLPPEIGNLTSLTYLNLSANQLSNLPAEIVNLPESSILHLKYNRLVISDDTLRMFLEETSPDWEDTQTVAPTDITAIITNSGSIELTWTPINFQEHGGFYEISIAEGATFTVHGTTESKRDSSYTIDGLASGATYQIRIRTYTPAHDYHRREIWSDYITIDVNEIRGSVWSDANANGLRDADEPGIAGVIVKIQSYIDGSISKSTATDTNGEYTFSGLDPSLSYFLTFEAPDGTIFSPQDIGGDDTLDSDVHPNTGQINFDDIPIDGIDAGIIEQPNGDAGGITGIVYRIDNGDEIGISGVTVVLQDIDRNIPAISLTNVDGDYSFINLQPGVYIVKFIAPEHTILSINNASIDLANGETDPINIAANVIVVDIDAILGSTEAYGDTLDCTGKGGTRPNFTGTIEGRVWNDFNRDGVYNDNSENGGQDINGDTLNDSTHLSGVTIICKCEEGYEGSNGSHRVQVATDKDGYYKFFDLDVQGKYIIEIEPPQNKRFTESAGIGPDSRNSDPNHITLKSAPIDFQENNNIVHIDAGLIPPLGDVNCDGLADSLDALFILQMDIGRRGKSPQCPPSPILLLDDPIEGSIYEPGCEVSKDGICGAVDALFILQCELGRHNDFCPEEPTVAADTRRGRENTGFVPDKATINIASKNISPGSTFIVTLMTTVEEELSIATIDIAYDPSQFRVVDCQADKDERFDIVDCNIDLAEKVNLGLLSGSEVSGTLRLADITFEHIGTVVEDNLLSINARTFAGPSGSPIEYIRIDRMLNIGHRAYLPLVER